MKSYLAVIALLALLCTLKADAAEERTGEDIADDFAQCIEKILTDANFEDDNTSCGNDADWKKCGKDYIIEVIEYGEKMAAEAEEEESEAEETEEVETEEEETEEEEAEEETCESLKAPMKLLFEGMVDGEADGEDLSCESSFDALYEGITEGCEEAQNGVGYKGLGFIAITVFLAAFNWLEFGN